MTGPKIDRLVLFGGTGDLAGRFLLPALVELYINGQLGDHFRLTATGRSQKSDDDYRLWAANWLTIERSDIPAETVTAFLTTVRYRSVDLSDPESVAQSINGKGPVMVYLALPPAVAPQAVSNLRAAGLPPESMVVLEKPFGEDLLSAQRLNRQLADFLDERHIFRVDHFLAMATVQNVLGMRLTNRLFGPIWNSTHIDLIEIVWDESLALEGRAGYYDHVGALKDMIQNHLLQLLCLVAMEPPNSLDERTLRDRKVDVLHSIRPFERGDIGRDTRRARYRAGTIDHTPIPAYADEPGITPHRQTETFAQIELTINNQRWSDTLFRLRSGKAMGSNRKEVIIHFRPLHDLPYDDQDTIRPNVAHFELEPDGLRIELNGTDPNSLLGISPQSLRSLVEPSHQSAYSRILADALNIDTTLSIRADEAEEAWRLLAPVLESWSQGVPPLEEYDAGSDGPARPTRSHILS
jgi:glucose-6-phosphate 1-dehydrogenase